MKKNARYIKIWISLCVMLCILIGNTINTYKSYKETIVKQQQEHLFAISKGIESGLEMYFDEQVASLGLIEKSNKFCKDVLIKGKGTSDKDFKTRIADYYEILDFVSMYIVDLEGKIVYQNNKKDYPYATYAYDFSNDVKSRNAGIGEIYQVAPYTLVMSIVQPIYQEEKQIGALISIIQIEDIYDRLAKNIKVGKKGYIMVKDKKGTIIMHPTKSQIGQKVIEGRKNKAPQLDYRDLEKLIEKQYKQNEGVAEYYSYWWNEEEPVKVKKISAFSTVNVGKDEWVVSAVMDYSEMAEPIQKNLNRLLNLIGIIILIIVLVILISYYLEKKRQVLLTERKYLEKLNYTLGELQKTEKRMKHYERLQGIETLTGGIAHEFNNLMTPILAYSQLALATMKKDNTYYEEMEEIYCAAEKAKELVQQIMLFSRRDKTNVNYKAINLSEEVMAGMKMVKAGLKSHIEVVEHIEHSEHLIYGNATQIQQVLINICNNGAYAMMGQEGILTVELYKVNNEDLKKIKSARLKGNEYLCLSISDTGCGMSEQVKQRIFDPFFTTKEVGKGTGVGLAVVKGIIHNHKGDIQVETEEGKGSSFKIYLPICCTEKLVEQEKSIIASDKSKIRILLIEDDHRVMKSMKKTFESKGYIITAYLDALETIEHFRKNALEYDIILSDYAMPKLNGIQLAKQLREIKPDIPIILVTGLIESEVIEHIRSQTIDDFVMKPIDYQEMDNKIANLLNKKV